MQKNRIKTRNMAGFNYPASKINAKQITKTLIFVQFCGRPPHRGAWIEIKLMKMAVELGKKVRPDMHCGICGEHGGDPSSVEFCHNIGLSYVSCSPFRVPIARLAAAQAAIKEKNQ